MDTTTTLIRRWFHLSHDRWSTRHAEHVWRLAQGWISTFGHRPPSELTVTDLEQHELSRAPGRSASALNQERSYLLSFLRYCGAHGVLGHREPASLLATWRRRRPQVVRQYRTLPREAQDHFLLALPENVQTPVQLALYTGLRWGTLRRLTFSHFQEDFGLRIPRGVQKNFDEIQLPLPPALRELIQQCRRPHDHQGRAHERYHQHRIFPHLPPANRLWDLFRRASAACDLDPPVTPHDLRRTFVARAAAAGVPLEVVQLLGGWRSRSVLLDHYYPRLTPAQARAALDAAH